MHTPNSTYCDPSMITMHTPYDPEVPEFCHKSSYFAPGPGSSPMIIVEFIHVKQFHISDITHKTNLQILENLKANTLRVPIIIKLLSIYSDSNIQIDLIFINSPYRLEVNSIGDSDRKIKQKITYAGYDYRSDMKKKNLPGFQGCRSMSMTRSIECRVPRWSVRLLIKKVEN
ncbi:hypothetical protein L2E82_24581 [Cichorium intybus]|uniref:Uncharacterized protein n=1 Tax=Cichorium intybus TaxID=13427 RepID=A0ACB9E249_CICIN|nr:hypothetical protein L2E82_24581 [Cichorium intybus]